MRFLSEKEVIVIHATMIQRLSPSEQIGVKDAKLLNSAGNRPKASAFGEDAYPTVFEKAAALFESLAKNHAFYNANKRTAFASLVMVLKKNGYDLRMDVKKAEDFTVSFVEKEITFEKVVSIIRAHSEKRN